MSAKPRCPTCQGARKPFPDNPSFPFCSPRCKLADLANWLDGRYSLATEEGPSTEDLPDARARSQD